MLPSLERLEGGDQRDVVDLLAADGATAVDRVGQLVQQVEVGVPRGDGIVALGLDGRGVNGSRRRAVGVDRRGAVRDLEHAVHAGVLAGRGQRVERAEQRVDPCLQRRQLVLADRQAVVGDRDAPVRHQRHAVHPSRPLVGVGVADDGCEHGSEVGQELIAAGNAHAGGEGVHAVGQILVGAADGTGGAGAEDQRRAGQRSRVDEPSGVGVLDDVADLAQGGGLQRARQGRGGEVLHQDDDVVLEGVEDVGVRRPSGCASCIGAGHFVAPWLGWPVGRWSVDRRH